MKKTLLSALAIVAACALMVEPALAQVVTNDPPRSPTTVYLGTLVDQVFTLLGVVLVAALGWLTPKLARWVGEKNAAMIRGYLQPVLESGLAYGQKEVGKLPLTIDAKNQIVATGANFVIEHVPDALKFFKIDEAGLKRILDARLETNINAQTPSVTATTPLTAPAPVAVPLPVPTA